MQCLLEFWSSNNLLFAYLIYVEIVIIPLNCTPLLKCRGWGRPGIAEKNFWLSSVSSSYRSSLICMHMHLHTYRCTYTKAGGAQLSYKALGLRAVCVKIDCPASNTGCLEILNAPKVRWTSDSRSSYLFLKPWGFSLLAIMHLLEISISEAA